MTAPLNIFLLMGQSNATGGADIADLTAPYTSYGSAYNMAWAYEVNAPKDFLGGAAEETSAWLSQVAPRANRIGPEMSLGRRLLERMGPNVGLIKHATDGSNLFTHWDQETDNSLWEYAVNFIDARLAEKPAGSRIGGVFWVQGNGDAGSTEDRANDYAERLGWLVTRLRNRYGERLPVVIDRLNDSSASAPYAANVRTQQGYVAQYMPYVYIAETSDLGMKSDLIHYTADSMVILGTRMADLMPVSYASHGTTWENIRAAQVAVVQALTPTSLATLGRFRPWEPMEGGDFEAWTDGAHDPFRVFEIRHGLDYQGEQEDVPGTDIMGARHSCELLVAYPNVVTTHGGKRLEHVIDEDISDLRQALGARGYENYDALGTGTHSSELTDTFVERRDACRILRIRFSLHYDRSI